jgi:FG-GAP-like repeat/RTX calcium-binding nonapeptide repeat (4 copies)
LGIDARSLTAADFNRDGKPDLAHTLPFDPLAIRDRVAVLWGTGESPWFEKKHSPWLYPGEEAVFITTANFNGDGVPDIATVNRLTQDVSVLLANQDGTFPQDDGLHVPQPGVYRAGNSPEELAAADFTIPSGGVADLVATNPGSDSVSFLKNNGDGTFNGAVEIPAVPGARSPLAADFDGDKTPDLAVAYDDHVAVLLRAGGTFQAPDSYEAGQNAFSLATADFNEDGKPDLAVALQGDGPFGENNGGVSVLLNTSGTPPVGDAACDMSGGGGKDFLAGTPADETICGLGGMDTIKGGGGNDTLEGGNGKDTLDTRDDTGGDTLIGGKGKDSCMGDAEDTEQSC